MNEKTLNRIPLSVFYTGRMGMRDMSFTRPHKAPALRLGW